jgi:signal transduction histidine kinase
VSYSRKIYLINPKFQIRFSLYVCLLVFLTSIIYPFSIYELMNSIITHFALRNPEISTYYSNKRDALIIFLILLHLGFTCLTFFICVFFSHKIAGPLYKLQKHLKLIRDENYGDKLFFRKGDYFQELADDVNDTFTQLEDNYKNDLVYLSEVTSYINNLSLVVPDDKRIVLSEISSRLTSMQDRFTKT